MSVGDTIKELGAKFLKLYEEVVTVKTRFEDLKDEVRRTLDIMQRLFDKQDARQTDIERRLAELEAHTKTVYQSVVKDHIATSFKPTVEKATEKAVLDLLLRYSRKPGRTGEEPVIEVEEELESEGNDTTSRIKKLSGGSG